MVGLARTTALSGFPQGFGDTVNSPLPPPSQLFKEVAEGVMVGGGRLPVRKQVGKAAQHRALLPPSPAQAQSPRLWSLVPPLLQKRQETGNCNHEVFRAAVASATGAHRPFHPGPAEGTQTRARQEDAGRGQKATGGRARWAG